MFFFLLIFFFPFSLLFFSLYSLFASFVHPELDETCCLVLNRRFLRTQSFFLCAFFSFFTLMAYFFTPGEKRHMHSAARLPMFGTLKFSMAVFSCQKIQNTKYKIQKKKKTEQLLSSFFVRFTIMFNGSCRWCNALSHMLNHSRDNVTTVD